MLFFFGGVLVVDAACGGLSSFTNQMYAKVVAMWGRWSKKVEGGFSVDDNNGGWR